MRDDLCVEAIRLARLVARLLPEEPEPQGLLALLLLQHSRRDARVDAAGELVTLEVQDRTSWDGEEIAEAVEILRAALERERVGAYQVQAAIAASHATAASADATDWPAIASLYRRLAELTPSPVVELNRAVAVAMADGPAAGLALLDDAALDRALDGYYLLPATRADLLRRLGRAEEAAEHYRRALELAPTETERRYLRARLGER